MIKNKDETIDMGNVSIMHNKIYHSVAITKEVWERGKENFLSEGWEFLEETLGVCYLRKLAKQGNE